MKRTGFLLTALVVVGVLFSVYQKTRPGRLPEVPELPLPDQSDVANPRQRFDGQEVVVYAYSSFVASWGAGPKIAKRFEELTGAKIRLLDAGDSRLLAKKFEMEGDRPGADVWLGFDGLTLNEIKGTGQWRPLDVSGIKWMDFSIKLSQLTEAFVPFDWAPLTFVYREGEITPPRSIEDLLSSKYRRQIAMMDPRTSLPGAVFLNWVAETKSNYRGGRTRLEAEVRDFFVVFNPNVLSYSPGWSQAYGLFKRGQAKLAWTYLSSPVYHWREEKDLRYQPAVLQEGHPVQVEFAAVHAKCRHCSAADAFVRFLLTNESQKTLMTDNVMFPARDGLVEGTEFEKLPRVKLLNLGYTEFADLQDQLLEIWKSLAR